MEEGAQRRPEGFLEICLGKFFTLGRLKATEMSDVTMSLCGLENTGKYRKVG